jgi:integrase
MTAKKASAPQGRIYQSTGVTHLKRESDTGVYYIKGRVFGHWKKESLKTAVRADAELLFRKRLKELERAAQAGVSTKLDLTVGECADLYYEEQRRLCRIGKLAQATVDSRFWALKKIWQIYGDSFRQTPVKKVTYDVLKAPHSELHEDFSATLVNTVKAVLVGIFHEAVEKGLLVDNPATRLDAKEKTDPQKPIPSDAELIALFDHITRKSSCNPKKFQIRDLIEFFCWTGARINEANHVLKSDVNLDQENSRQAPTITFRVAKNGLARTIPIIPGAIPLIERLLSDESTGEKLLGVTECLETLERSCRALNQSKWTHHTFRHVFATRALEATNCDYFTVAHWLGHQDGGKLLAKRYAHLNQEHSQKQARKVSFKFAKDAGVPTEPTIEVNGVRFNADEVAEILKQANVVALPKKPNRLRAA